MAQTGFTPLLIYSSSTGGNAPTAGNLLNNATGSELAINIADGKLFYKDSANAVQVIGWKTVPTTAGGTGLTSYTAGDMVYWASGTAFTKLGIGAFGTVLTSSGSAPQWSSSLSVSGSLTAATGLVSTGTFAGTPPADGIVVDYATGFGRFSAFTGDGFQWFTGGVGTTKIMQLSSAGAITTATWNGSTIGVGYGGTGTSTTFTAGSVIFAGASGVYSQDNAYLYYDSTSKKLGINTNTVGSYLTVNGDGSFIVSSASATTPLILANNNTSGITTAKLAFQNGGGTKASINAAVYGQGYMDFSTNADTFAMRIDASQNLLVGATAVSNIGGASLKFEAFSNGAGAIGGYQLGAGGYVFNSYAVSNGGTYYHVYFSDAGTSHGSITSNGTTTSYNITSDYRLKENVAPMQNALETIAKLNPVTYKWVGSELTGQGFIAHELQAVVPDCVTGEKDAVDKDGNPVYQQMDSSFLIGLLTKSIQELNEKFDAYVASHP